MATQNQLSTAQLRQALQLSEQIEAFQAKLDAILGGGKPASTPAALTSGKVAKTAKNGRRTMSLEARALIGAAMKARWAKKKGNSASTKSPKPAAPKKKRKLSPEGRANLVAAAKARWAARNEATE